jgi:cell pole-organizing protein PopZ
MTGDRAKESASVDAAAGEAGHDGQAEPSMEDILASIRRILTDDATEESPASPSAPAPAPAPAEGAPPSARDEPAGAAAPSRPRPAIVREPARADNVFLLTPEMRVPDGRPPIPPAEATKRKVMSSNTAETGTDVLAQLAGAILDRRDIAIGARDVTLESMVREMLRPLLREWLDRNLPYLIERLVKREIDLMVNRAERLED